jgi:hypothetical protein
MAYSLAFNAIINWENHIGRAATKQSRSGQTCEARSRHRHYSLGKDSVARISVVKEINVSPNLDDEGPVASVTSSVTGRFLLILWADCKLMQIQKLVCC